MIPTLQMKGLRPREVAELVNSRYGYISEIHAFQGLNEMGGWGVEGGGS